MTGSAPACAGGSYRVPPGLIAVFREQGVTCWEIDGARADSRNTFFRALAESLQFPGYFGHNWDAVYDCLTDLRGAHPQVAIVVRDGALWLAGMGAEWPTAQRVFADAAAFWQESSGDFRFLLDAAQPIPGVADAPLVCLTAWGAGDALFDWADARAVALNRAGDEAAALALAQDVVAAFPEDPRAHFVLGGAHDAQGREHDAVACYRKALALGLSGEVLPGFYVQYGSTLRNVGEADEAVRVLTEGSQRFPDLLSIRAFLSLALLSAGRADDAVATALDALLRGRGAEPDLERYGRSLRAYIRDLQGANAAE